MTNLFAALKKPGWSDALGIFLTVAMLLCVTLEVSRNLAPFSALSIEHGSVALAVVVTLVWGLSRLSHFSAAPVLLAPLFLVCTGNLIPLLGWSTFLVASVLVGACLSARLRVLRPMREALTELGASFVIGLAVNSAIIWVAMHFPINYSGTYWSFFAAETLLLGFVFPSCRPKLAVSWSPGRYIILVYALMILPNAVVPAHNFDDLSSHLFIPHQTELFGRFVFSPLYAGGLGGSPLTMGAYTSVFITGGENAVRLLNVSMFVFGFLALEAWVRRRFGAREAVVTTLFAILFPFTCWTIGIVFIDSFLFFFSTLFFILGCEFLLRRDATLLPGAAILASTGYFAKQQMLFIILPLALPFVVVSARLLVDSPRNTSRQLFLAVFLFGAVLAPPLLHNYILSGNPLFPFFNGIFRSPYWPAEDLKDTRWNQAFDLACLWKITFNGSKFVENMDYAFGFSALVFAPLLFVRSVADLCRRNAVPLLMLLCALGYAFICYKVTGLYLRYLAGLIAPLSLALGVVVCEATTRSRLAKGVVYTILTVVLVGNFAAFLSIRNAAEPYPIVASLTGSLDESSMAYHANFKRLFRTAGERFGKESLGLLIDSPASYLADTRIVSNLWLFPATAAGLASKGDAESLFTYVFQEQQIRYIIMPLSLPERGFGDPAFRKRLRRIGRTADFGLFIPRPSQPVGQTPEAD